MVESAPQDRKRLPPSMAKPSDPAMKAKKPICGEKPPSRAVAICSGIAIAASVRPAIRSPGRSAGRNDASERKSGQAVFALVEGSSAIDGSLPPHFRLRPHRSDSSCLAIGSRGQRDFEPRATRTRFHQFQFSRVPFDDCPANGQSQTHSAGLCGKERIKDAFLICCGNSRTGILHGKPHRRGGVSLDCQVQRSCTIVLFTESIDGIAKQIEHDLLDLHPIDTDERNAILKIRFYRYPVRLDIVLNESQCLPDNVSEVCRRSCIDGILEHSPRTRDGGLDAIGVGFDIPKYLP